MAAAYVRPQSEMHFAVLGGFDGRRGMVYHLAVVADRRGDWAVMPVYILGKDLERS